MKRKIANYIVLAVAIATLPLWMAPLSIYILYNSYVNSLKEVK